jgi:hypothetical protein
MAEPPDGWQVLKTTVGQALMRGGYLRRPDAASAIATEVILWCTSNPMNVVGSMRPVSDA